MCSIMHRETRHVSFPLTRITRFGHTAVVFQARAAPADQGQGTRQVKVLAFLARSFCLEWWSAFPDEVQFVRKVLSLRTFNTPVHAAQSTPVVWLTKHVLRVLLG